MIAQDKRKEELKDKMKNSGSVIMRIAVILLSLTLLSCGLITGRYARFTTGDSSGDSARVAKWVFVVENNGASSVFLLQDINKPGDSQTFSFVVKNNSGSSVSEVSESYTLDLSIDGGIPLTGTFTKNSGTPVNVNAVSTGSASASATGSFLPGSNDSDTYDLVLTWPDTYILGDVYSSGRIMSYVTLTVTGVQID